MPNHIQVVCARPSGRVAFKQIYLISYQRGFEQLICCRQCMVKGCGKVSDRDRDRDRGRLKAMDSVG